VAEPCEGSVTLAVRDVRRASEDALTGIRGTVDIAGDGELLVSLPELLVVELADQLDAWLIGVDGGPGDFVYSSVEHDEPGIVYLHQEPPCWRVGSIWSTGERELDASLRTVAAAAADYVAAVDHLVEPLGLDLPRLLGQRRR
jgi:hypothetical protein